MATLAQIDRAIEKYSERGNQELVDELFKERARIQDIILERRYGKSVSDAGILENIGKGLGTGFTGFLETSAIGAATLLEEENELAARKKIKDFFDIEALKGADEESLPFQISAGLGSIAALAPTAFLGGSALPTAGVLAAGAGAGEASERARDFGATEGERSLAALKGIAVGATEVLPLGRIFQGLDRFGDLGKNLQIPEIQKVLNKLGPESIDGIKSRIQSAAGTTVVEGAQEGAAAILQNLIEQGYNPEKELVDAGVLEEAFIGGTAGGIFQGLVDFLVKGKDRTPDTDTDTDTTVDTDEAARLGATGIDEEARLDATAVVTKEEAADIDKKIIDEVAGEEGKVTEEDPTIITEEEDANLEYQAMLERYDKEAELKAEELIKEINAEIDAAINAGASDAELAAIVESYGGKENIYLKAAMLRSKKERETTDATGKEDLSAVSTKELKARLIAEKNNEAIQVELMRRSQKEADDARVDETRVGTGVSDDTSGQTGKDVTTVTETDDARVVSDGKGVRTTDVRKTEERGALNDPRFASYLSNLNPKGTINQIAEQNSEGFDIKSMDEFIAINNDTKKLRFREGNTPEFIKNILGPKVESLDVDKLQRLKQQQKATQKVDKQIGTKEEYEESVRKRLEKYPDAETVPYEQRRAEYNNQLKVDRYVEKFDNPTDAIANAIYEVADEQAQTQKIKEGTEEKGEEDLGSDIDPLENVYEGLGGANAEALITWTQQNLSEPVRNRIAARLEATRDGISAIRQRVEEGLEEGFDTDAFRNAELLDRYVNEKINFQTVDLSKTRTDTGPNEFFDTRADALYRTRPFITDTELTKLKKDQDKTSVVSTGAEVSTIEDDVGDDDVGDTTDVDPRINVIQAAARKVQTKEDKTKKVTPFQQRVDDLVNAKIETLSKKDKTKLSGMGKSLKDTLDTTLRSIRMQELEDTKSKQRDPDEFDRRISLEIADNYFATMKSDDLIDAAELASQTIDMLKNKLPTGYVNKLDGMVDDSVATLIKEGDLSGALQELSNTSTDKRVKQIARVLSGAVGTNAKVEIMESGDNYAKGNIAYINQNKETDGGLYVHTVLHEAAHVAVNNITDNKPSHPMTRQLNRLFEQVKDNLEGDYGVNNLQEFISEALSNSSFQSSLAAIYPDGKPITALGRFFRSITNFLRKIAGMETKPLDSALDLVDRELIAFLSPTPATRDSGSMSAYASRDGAKKLAKEIGDIQKGFARPTPKFQDDFGRETLDITDKMANIASKSGIFSTFDSLTMGDVAKARGFGDLGTQLHQLIQSVRGKKAESDRLVKEEVTKVSNWAKKNPKEMEMLNDLIYSREYGATIYQVDPTLTLQQAKDRYITTNKKGESKYEVDKESGKELFSIWNEQQKIWSKLEKSGGHKIYTGMRDMYKRQYKQLERVIKGRLDEVVGEDKEAAAELKKSVYDRLFDNKTLDVYFPLVRSGKYKLTYSQPVEKGKELAERDTFVVLMFETEAERDAQAMKARADKKLNITVSDGDISFDSYRNNPDGSFVNQVLTTLEKAQASNEVKQEIMDLFVKALPETSFAKSLARRKGFEGYEKDAIFAMRSKAYDLGAQVERLKVTGEIYKVEDAIVKKGEELNRALETANQKSTTNAIVDDLLKRAKFTKFGASNKTLDGIARNLNQGAFIYTIGFNASSALVNVSQLPMFVYPMLSARYGASKTYQAMQEATGITFSSRNAIDAYFDAEPVIEKDKDGNDVPTGEVNYTLKKDLPKNLEKVFGPLDVLVKRASQRSYLTQSFLADALGLDESTQTWEFLSEKLGLERAKRVPSSDINPFTKALNSISATSAIMFNAGEKFNRQTTLVASYNLALGEITKNNPKDKDGNPKNVTDAQKAEAADQAMDMTTQYNGGAVIETGARISQDSLGRVAFMYKNFGMRMYTTMFQTGKRFLDNAYAPSPNETAAEKAQRILERNIAAKQLIGIHASSILLAGAQAAPLYSLYQLIAGAFNLLYEEDEEGKARLDDVDTMARQYLTEGWYKGPLVQLLGIDFSERIRLNNLLFQENRFNYNPSLEENLFYYFGGPAFSTAKRFERGIENLRAGEVERGIENFIPPAITNAYRNTLGRYAEEGSILTRRGDPIASDLNAGDLFAGAIGFPPIEYTQEQDFKNTEQRIKKEVNAERAKILRDRNIAINNGDAIGIREATQKAIDFNRKYRDVTTNRITFESMKKSLSAFRRYTEEMRGTSSNMSGGYERYFLDKRDTYDNSTILSQLLGD